MSKINLGVIFGGTSTEHEVSMVSGQSVVEHLQGKSICTCDGLSATTTNWVMDRILNKL
mgnify:CR=1 FL=1